MVIFKKNNYGEIIDKLLFPYNYSKLLASNAPNANTNTNTKNALLRS